MRLHKWTNDPKLPKHIGFIACGVGGSRIRFVKDWKHVTCPKCLSEHRREQLPRRSAKP